MTDALRQQLQASLGTAFTIERELGGGGMSRVFLALDEHLGRHVVVKVLAPELAEGLSAERFTRETQLAARLQHPNIVPVLSAGAEPGGLPYYTMPYIDGASLRARLITGPLPLAEALAVLRDVARALAYAHALDVVHRDIKPDNVLLTGGAAVVADFGIAKAVRAAGGGTTLTGVGVSIGTPAYMAPEQALGDDVDERADLYAWGVVAYELLAGAHPFADRITAQQLVSAHVTETPRALSSVAGNIPPAIAVLVMRCLDKNPAARPSSASELLRVLDDGATSGREQARIAGAHRGAASRRRTIGVVAIGVALFAIASGWMWRRNRAMDTESGSTIAPTAPVAPRIAVLPFENLGRPEDEAFAAGITEEITSRLAEISALRVVSRTSAKRFRHREASIKEVGDSLHADYVLEGTVRTESVPGRPSVVRITPQLIRVADDVSVWQKPLDATLSPGDLFGVQSAVAEKVAEAMNVTLLAHERVRVARVVTLDSAAYQLYQRGRFHWEKRTPESLVLAQRHFREAIARDPRFAGAWAGLGDATFIYLIVYGSPEGIRLGVDTAVAALRRAVEIDSTLAEGWAGLAYALTLGRWDRAGADSAFRRTIALDPSYAPARYWYAQLGFLRQDTVAALAQSREAVALDPLSAVAHQVLGLAYEQVGRRDHALAEYERAAELQPGFRQVYLYLMFAYARRGWLARAEESAQRWLVPYASGSSGRDISKTLAGALAGTENPAAAAKALTRALPAVANEVSAALFATRGMADSAFARLDAAIDDRSGTLVPLLGILAPLLRNDPRWNLAVSRMQPPTRR